MLHGPRVDLRAQVEEDVPVLHAELYEDVEMRSRSDGAAWRPRPLGASPLAPREPDDKVAGFSVVVRETGGLAGSALLWGIDQHNRLAHVGISLRPTMRGHGYGREVVEVLSDYAFRVLGLHRLQLETLADNDAMIAVALHCGFELEGRSRESSWVDGGFRDDVVFGLLAPAWQAREGERTT
jgi:RimJ/RimL family protein N-acetyltransferase